MEQLSITTAEWIYGEDEGQDGYYCSSCGFFAPWCYNYEEDSNYIRKYNYCPHCGSKMQDLNKYVDETN